MHVGHNGQYRGWLCGDIELSPGWTRHYVPKQPCRNWLANYANGSPMKLTLHSNDTRQQTP